jgi:tricorn protease-like protein
MTEVSDIARQLAPFVVDHNGYVWATSAKGGQVVIAKIQIRGWGYLTGGGHGALGLSDEKALEIQEQWRVMIETALNAFAENDFQKVGDAK